MAAILVIEDNLDNRELMTYLLRAFGHDVTAAGDGIEALEMLAGSSFDLIVCDVHLPKMDGYQVLEAVEARSEGHAPPVIAVTALAMVGDRNRLLDAGFHGYVPKPIEPETFVRQVEAFLVAADTGGEDH
jgi:two-component system cell cycle response regulator